MHKVLKDVLDSPSLGFNTMIQKIHDHLGTQIRTVRGMMESDRIKIPNKMSEVMEGLEHLFVPLLHKVSHVCFELLLAMYFDVVNGNYHEMCVDHWWKDCFGIPCIHRVAAAIVEDKPIELDEIHLFWKQLTWEGYADASSQVNAERSISENDLRWNAIDEKYRSRQMSQDHATRLISFYEDIEMPSRTKTAEPSLGKEKGRPKGTLKYSRRDPTALEHTMHRLGKGNDKVRDDTDNTTTTRKTRARKKQPKAKSVVDAPTETEDVIHLGVYFGPKAVDSFMYNFIGGVRDVCSDGNCGYRALACVLGWEEDQWRYMRSLLANELKTNRGIYELASMFNELDVLIPRVSCHESPAPFECWMEIPIVGLVFATCFQVALVCLSASQPHTCLPMTTGGGVYTPPTNIFAIAHVRHGTHFVPVRPFE